MTEKKKAEYLEWLVECRSRNQRTSLQLYQLLEAHSEKIKNNSRLLQVSISLIAVSFSLWRAVFLADRTGGAHERFGHAFAFLETLIRDNAITYVQDKSSREWTFNYYINNARYRLVSLSEKYKDILPPISLSRKIKDAERWEYLQKYLDSAVTGLSKAVEKS
jgi:hypothetical protein